MSDIVATASFDVEDSATASASVRLVIQPPVGFGTGGQGRLTHPTFGTLDFETTPTSVTGLDGDLVYSVDWLHSRTLEAGVDTFWQGSIQDIVVTLRWAEGDVGCSITHLQALQTYFAEQDPDDPIILSPNFATGLSFHVAFVGLRAGGQGYTVDTRLKSYGYAPQPVEADFRILGIAEI